MTTPVRPLFLVSGGPATAPLWPLLAEKYDLVFLYPQAAQQAQALGLRAGALAGVVDGDLQEHVATESVKLTARVVGGMDTVGARIATAYSSLPPDALNGHLGEWFPGFAHHLISAGVSILAQLERLRATGTPIAGCITHEDVSLDTRALVNWCNARGIPTIHVPHAPCHLLPGVQDIHRQTRARWIAASGPAVAEFYAESGHDKSYIVITGGPQYDQMYIDRPGRAEARRVLGIDHAGPVLAYQTTWGQTTSLRSDFDTEFERGFQAVLAAARDLGAYVMVKVHWHDQRLDTLDRYEASLRAANVPGLVTRDHFLYVLAAADVLVAQGPSNVCLEAAMYGVPSAYIQTEGFDFATALPYRGTVDTIGAAIGQALRGGGDWDGFVSAYNAAHPDGDAAARVMALVESVCG